jgi:hypothetical protein
MRPPANSRHGPVTGVVGKGSMPNDRGDAGRRGDRAGPDGPWHGQHNWRAKVSRSEDSISRLRRRALAKTVSVRACDNVADATAGVAFMRFSLPAARDVPGIVESNLHAPERKSSSSTHPPRSLMSAARRRPGSPRSATAFSMRRVSGGPAGAAAGALTMSIGGADADMAGARPVIDALSSGSNLTFEPRSEQPP